MERENRLDFMGGLGVDGDGKKRDQVGERRERVLGERERERRERRILMETEKILSS